MDKEIEVTLLSVYQIFGGLHRLKMFDEYGAKAAITDFAILLGGYVSNDYYYNNSNSLEDRSGWYWTSSDNKANSARVVYPSGNSNNNDVSERYGGARPALPYSVISKISSNVVRGRRDGILEVECGEYPQKAVSKILQEELESAYKHNQTSIRKTGKTYTTDSRRWGEYSKRFSAQEHEEFEYKEKRYVRVKSNFYYDCSEKLSNGEKYKVGDYVWVEVSSIKWLVDVEKNIALSERILFAGVQFNRKRNYKGNFKETFMYQFLNNIFIKDIQVQSKDKDIENIEDKEKDEIDKLFEEIKKFAKYSDNIDELYNYLNGLIANYNNDVTRVLNNKNELKVESVDSYKTKLILKLELILDKLKVLYEKKYVYEEIMNLLENYKNILNGVKVNTSDELTEDFKKIYEVLNFIDSPKLVLEFTNLIENETEKIKNYLNKSENITIEYDDIKAFELYFRFKLHPLLIQLNTDVVNKDVVTEIKNIIENDMYKIDEKQKNSIISFYLNLINEEIKVIRKLDKFNKYKKEISNLSNIDISKLQDIDKTLKLLTEIIIKLYEIEIKLKEDIVEKNYIKENIKKYVITKSFV